MKYAIAQSGPDRTVTFEGTLTHQHQDMFRQVLDDLADARGCAIEIDLSGLTAIDSTGLGLLLMLNDHAHKADSTVSLKAAHGVVKHALDLARFGEVFTIH